MLESSCCNPPKRWLTVSREITNGYPRKLRISKKKHDKISRIGLPAGNLTSVIEDWSRPRVNVETLLASRLWRLFSTTVRAGDESRWQGRGMLRAAGGNEKLTIWFWLITLHFAYKLDTSHSSPAIFWRNQHGMCVCTADNTQLHPIPCCSNKLYRVPLQVSYDIWSSVFGSAVLYLDLVNLAVSSNS